MEEDLNFNDQAAPNLSFEDPVEAQPLPPDSVIQARAEKTSFGLGDQSPGVESVKQTIMGGGENTLRTQVAAKLDQKELATRQQMLVQAAQERGGQLTDNQALLLRDVSQLPPPANDPGTALERVYADKFVNTVLGQSKKMVTPEGAAAAVEEGGIAASAMESKEYFQTGYENLLAKQQKQGWLRTIADYAVELLPILPWYRQAQALEERPFHISNLLPGKSMKDNVQYIWSLPMPEQKRVYTAAMKYLEANGNVLDQMQFTQALISFSTSDEYLANAMGIADYATLGSPLVKALTASRGAKVATGRDLVPVGNRALVPTEARPSEFKPAGLLSDQRSLEARSSSDAFINQTDMFGEPPAQGSFRFMNAPEQNAPPFGAGLPPGRLRAAHTTEFGTYTGEGGSFQLPSGTREVPPSGLFRDAGGQIRRSSEAYKQGELPLSSGPHQTELPLEAPRKPVQEPGEPKASSPTQEIKSSLAEAVKATEGSLRPEPEAVLGAAGHVEQASFIGAVKKILNPLITGNKDVLKEVPTFANPGGFLQDSKVVSRERARRLAPFLQESGDRLVNRFWDLARATRLTEDQLAIARVNAEKAFARDYAGSIRANDLSFDIVHLPAERHPSRVYTSVMKIGMPDNTLFPTVEKAQLYRSQLGFSEKEARIYRQGSEYFIGISKHLDEAADNVRDAVLTNLNTSNKGMINNLLNRVRSTEDMFSMLQRGNRHVVTHAPQELRKAIRDFVKENIEGLPKQSRRDLEDILRLNRDTPNPLRPTERGLWYNSAGELERAWLARHKRLPTEKEILAYDQFRRLSDFDWLARNVTTYRDKAIQGVESFRYSFKDETGKRVFVDNFEGKRLDKMPWSLGKADQDAGVWIHDGSTGKGKFHYKFNMDEAARKEVDDLLEKGYSVVQIFDPKKHPLQGIAKTAAGDDLKDQVNYVITNTWERSPLSWNQVDYRPGGHVIYAHKWYVSQPQIQMGRLGKATYLGDNHALNVRTEAEAKKWAEKLDVGRQLLKQGRLDELNTYIDRELPHTRDQFYDLFRRSDSPFSMDHEIVYKEEGKNTIQTVARLKTEYDNGNLIDATRNVHDLSNFMDKSFLMDRDNILSGVLEKKGVLRLADAEQLDPYIALNRAMGQNLRNIWMNEYKVGAINQWIKEFEHVMRPTDKTLAAHPLFFLYNPQWENVASSARGDLMAAKAARRGIINFIGTGTELGDTMDALKTKLLNGIYNTTGQGWMLDKSLAATSDPVQFLRGVAFHSKLGMFNPVQLFVQAQSMAHSIAVAGARNGIPGFAAAPLIRALGHNPDMLDTVAGVATKLGWTKSQFKEMYETLQKTGLYQVAGEAALRDDAFDPHLFRSTLGAIFLDAGSMFFNEGERLTRMTAFATAFREWRTANAATKIGDREIGQIMRRADDLSVNMTRASNAAWQTGVLSIPTQFFAYNARVMEQLLGGRLSAAEKLRVTAVYSTLYGLPIGLGAWVGGVFPMYDSIKQEAFKRGINLNEGVLKVLSEGVMGVMGNYNFAQRFGPGNQQAIKDALDGDKTIPDILLGASGSILGDTVKALAPFWYHTAQVFGGGGEYPVTSQDWLNVARNVATFDLAAKQYGVLMYGKWLTKGGTVVTSKAEPIDAVAAAFGLTPREVSDTFLWQKAIRGQQENKDQYVRWAQEQYRYGLQYGAEGNFTAMNDFFTRGKTALEMGDLTMKEKADAYRRALSQNKDLAEKVKWDAFNKASKYKNDIYENFIRK